MAEIDRTLPSHRAEHSLRLGLEIDRAAGRLACGIAAAAQALKLCRDIMRDGDQQMLGPYHAALESYTTMDGGLPYHLTSCTYATDSVARQVTACLALLDDVTAGSNQVRGEVSLVRECLATVSRSIETLDKLLDERQVLQSLQRDTGIPAGLHHATVKTVIRKHDFNLGQSASMGIYPPETE